MNSFKRVLASVGAVALVASGGVVIAAGPAQAAPSITVSPNKDLKDGDVVQVEMKGFSPNSPVAVGLTQTGRESKGPGDAGRTKNGNSKLTTTDASGNSSAEITISTGGLGNLTPPEVVCPPCDMAATNIASGGAEAARVKLNYAKAGGGNKKPVADPVEQPADEAPAETPGNSAPNNAQPKDLAQTGPRETALMAIGGFVLLQIGLIFAVRASRSGPRRAAL
jgi:hypothetical protein